LLFIGLLFSGLLIQNRNVKDTDLPYIKNLQTKDGMLVLMLLIYIVVASKAIDFATAALIIIGYPFTCIFLSYGLTSLPVRLMHGSKNSMENLLKKLSEIEAEREEILEKYHTSSPTKSKRISRKDKEALEELGEQERAVKRKIRQVEAHEQSITNKVFKALRPIEVYSAVH
jgi:hypothetical protein